MELQQSQLNQILEAVQSNQPASSAYCNHLGQVSQSQVHSNNFSLPPEEVSSSPNQCTSVGARVSWGCSGSKISRKKFVHKDRGGCQLRTQESGGVVMKDLQSCGKHKCILLIFTVCIACGIHCIHMPMQHQPGDIIIKADIWLQ